MRYQLHLGDNREVLKSFDDNSIDSIVCDPPYELGFMGKKWDSTGIAYDVTLWMECLRVLKPGGHLLAFGGSRTYHRLAVAIEDAGFEIRDCIMWLYGSGFPKSHDVSKALDKQAGAEREVVDIKQRGSVEKALAQGVGYLSDPANKNNKKQFGYGTELITTPATDLAKQWQGWGTALKPAHEPIVVARKPLQGTVADNVTAWGVGGINIDGCRIETTDNLNGGAYTQNGTTRNDGWGMQRGQAGEYQQPSGRWPANIILDEEAAQMLDEQSGVSKSGIRTPTGKSILDPNTGWNDNSMTDITTRGFFDSGGASRFFYVAKASRIEREAGLEGLNAKQISAKGNGLARTCETCGASTLEGCECENRTYSNPSRLNHHTTVKPITLMRYLVRLVTPRDGVVLDPFMGSGTTGCAAMLEGMRFIGIELNEEYVEIAEKRIKHWSEQNPMNI